MRKWVIIITDDDVDNRMRWHSLIELGALRRTMSEIWRGKTVVLNTYLSYKFKRDCDILENNVPITPSSETIFLGVIMDKKSFFVCVKTL